MDDFSNVKVGDKLAIIRGYGRYKSINMVKVLSMTSTRVTVVDINEHLLPKTFTKKDGNPFPREKSVWGDRDRLVLITEELREEVRKIKLFRSCRGMAKELYDKLEKMDEGIGLRYVELDYVRERLEASLTFLASKEESKASE